MNKKSIAITLLLVLVLVFVNYGAARAVPPLPSSFYGPVRLDGALVPADTLISARIGGVEYATTLTTIYLGDSVYAIDIPGDDPDTPGKDGGVTGDVIRFYMNGIEANETALWTSGTNVLRPLTFETNHPPTAANNTVTTLEDTDKVFAAADFNFADVDAGDTLAQVQITSLPGAGTLYLDSDTDGVVDTGEAVTVNQVVISADIPKLKFKPAANANGTSYATFQFKVHDGEVYSVSAYTMTVNVTPVNDAPSFVKGADQTVQEDAGAQTVTGWATSITDGDPEATQTLTFNVTGNTNPGLFSAGPAVNATTGTLTYTPAPNANGSATITLT
ncbi:MAG: Ig-like domain-containing protein, partial [Anaerolineales bacterium]